MLFFKLWLTGIIILVITSIIIRNKAKDVICVVRGHQFQIGEIEIRWAWIPLILSIGLFGGMPNGLLFSMIVKKLLLIDILLMILVLIVIMLITICLTKSLIWSLIGIETYFEERQERICTYILLATITIWTNVFCIL